MSEKPPGSLSAVSKRVKKAFIAYIDTHIGTAIAERFLSLNYEVSAMCKTATAPSASSIAANPVYSKITGGIFPRTSDPEAIRRALLDADVVVYHTPGCAEDSVRALRVLETSVFDTSNEKRFILVSSAQSWFETTSMSTSASQLAQQNNFVVTDETTDEDIAGLLEGVSEDQYNRRIPHVRHQAWRDVEKMCAATNSEGRVRTFVVFAGLVYGAGEDFLLPYFKQAWSLAPAGLPIFGSGNQLVPMIHAADLTSFVQELATNEAAAAEGFPRYTFAVDEGSHTWRSIVKAVNSQLGNGRTFNVPPQEYGLYENVEQFTINLKVEPGQIQELVPEENWQCKSGFVQNIIRVTQEFRQARNLMPHRILLVGPPSSGKSYVAKNLAELFQVPHLTINDIIAEYRYQEAELLEAITVRKQERLVQRKTEKLEEKRRQFVDDRKNGIDNNNHNNNNNNGDDDDEEESYHNSRKNQQKIDPDDDEIDSEADDEALAIELTDEELKEVTELVDDENNADETIQMMNDKIAEVKRVCAMKWKPITEETPEPVNPRDKLKSGAKTSSGISASNNNNNNASNINNNNKSNASQKRTGSNQPGGGSRGGGRGKEIVEEESAEEKAQKQRLSDRALGFMVRWKLSASASCRNQGYVLDGFPKTVRQARLVFEDTEHDVPEDPENEPDLPLDKEVKPANNQIFPEYVVQLSAGDDFLLHRLLRTQHHAAHNVPEHFQRRLDAYKANFDVADSVIHYFESTRTTPLSGTGGGGTSRVAHVKHVNVDSEPLVPEDIPPPARVSQFDPKTYPSLALKIADLIGCPRNLGPSPADALREAQRSRNLADEELNIEAEKQRAKAQLEAEELAAVKESRRQLDEKAKRLQSVERQMLEERKAPLKAYLMHNVIPVLTKGLMEVCIKQPDDPVEFLAEWLFRHNPEDHPEMYS